MLGPADRLVTLVVIAMAALGQDPPRDEALALLRDVLAGEDTPDSRAMLLRALTAAERMSPEEKDEALEHARVLVQDPELDPLLIAAACEAAVKSGDRDALGASVSILRKRVPGTVATHLYAWPLAMQTGDLEAPAVSWTAPTSWVRPSRTA